MRNKDKTSFPLFKIYQSLFENNPETSYVINPEGKFVLVNKHASILTGYTEEELYKKQFSEILTEEDVADTSRIFHGILTGYIKECQFEVTIVGKSGEQVTIHVTSAPIIVDKKIWGVIGVAQDITENKRILCVEKKLREQLQNIFERMDVCFWSIDVKNKNMLQISPACKEIYGYSVEEFIKNPGLWKTNIHPEDQPIVNKIELEIQNSKDTVEYEYRIITKTNKVKWLASKVFPVYNTLGELIRFDGIISDTSKQKVAENQLEYMAYHDNLTGLPNRRMFHKHFLSCLKQAKRNSKQLYLLYLDLDRFKWINDTLGHSEGDKLLKVISKRIKECISENDLVSRHGGDEFAVILSDENSIANARFIAQEILNKIAAPVILKGIEYHVTTSIGISIYPDHAKYPNDLMKKADLAMYAAKENGRSDIQMFHDGMNQALERKVIIEQSLRKAIKNNEFSLEYQPIVNVQLGKWVGFEALLRWNSGKLGNISPNEFIPIAEESGYIVDIGKWVLKQACLQLKELQAKGYSSHYVSVNVSAKQFEHEYFIPYLKEVLKETGIEPCHLKLEITESVAMKNIETSLEKLNYISKLGIGYFLDDFGTGYSSLSYLTRTNIEVLKIDRSFVTDIGKKKEKEAVIKAVMALTSILGIKVIAEGVEEEEQLSYLTNLGCNKIQGYLFCKPLNFDDIPKVQN